MQIEQPPRKRAKRKKKWKTWQKWTLGVISFIVVAILIFVGFIYYYIKSMDIDDIVARHSDETVAVNQTADAKPAQDKPRKVPAIIKKPVEKASKLLGGQEIKSDDALDVAAILLKSGLNLKQISYLQGNAAYDLSAEEKQKIRDMLVSKLTKEEINALRNITKQYGIGLNILNPDYPIEWVGERDPEKLKENGKAWEEMQTKPKDQVKQEPQKDATAVTKDNEPSTETDKELTAEQQQKKKDFDAKTKTQLGALSGTCKVQSNNILNEILASTSGKVSLKALQDKFLGKVVAAEASCDAQFQTIQSSAKSSYESAGISTGLMPNWSTEYEAGKSSARAAAISAIAKAIKKDK
ncbi:hypothetical protein [Paenibacillus sp. OV219]|uniref:hypothetical protein n=1 Tax=Paenibacillus sp. OV219 TaxID=1884377 RepID=UPI0008D550B0|nr:hypothetical protein [Paenibacillus sp. OV219]SEN61865.1 hypothetical protein SAMN05518847_103336 [Paenibacillus sp. OV219]